MSRATPSSNTWTTSVRTITAVFAVLVVARVLGLISVYFFEEDEVSLAVGAAALVADTPAHLYRYTVQVGYYRLIEGIDLILGAQIAWIPWIMKILSALAGAWIPIAGFFAFRQELTIRQRWLIVMTLALNPIVWRSSQYGNAGLIATAFASTGLIILSNRPARAVRIGALALFGIGTLVRADTVLLAPVVYFLLRDAEGHASAFKTSVIFGLVMALFYAGLLAVDPNADNPARSVTDHMLDTPSPTMFWEFLLWAMSPMACMFAIWGFRSLLEGRGRVALLIVIWCVPTLLFYFRATTTCRYFLNVVVPVSVLGAVGMDELAGRAGQWLRPRMAWALVLGLASVHLFVALGRTLPSEPRALFYGGTFPTHDGQMPTGALLVRTYLTPGSLLRSLPHPKFGAQDDPYWEGVALNKAIRLIADPAAPKRTVVVLIGGGFGHAFHFHALAAGARYTDVPHDQLLWVGPAWLQLGNARVLTVRATGPGFASLKQIDVKADDLVWTLRGGPFPDAETLSKLPPGLSLVPTEAFDPHIRTFRVSGG